MDGIGELQPVPTITADEWAGYQHYMDTTLQPFNTLGYPSTNCTMPKGDKVMPDKGKTLLGQQYTQNQGIIGNMEKFTNMGGFELEVRVYHSDQYIDYITLVGTFQVGEIITGSVSGNTATIISQSTGRLLLSNVSGPFQILETVTGSISGATAIVSVGHTTFEDVIEVLYTDPNPSGLFFNIPHWYQITQNVNPLPPGLHRYSFDQWFDTNIDPALSLNLPRLIWVNGLSAVFSWTGGIAPILAINPGVSISTTPGVTWASLGFVDPALGGSGNIIINGISYGVTGGWGTDTLTLTNTTDIFIGELAFAQIDQNFSDLFTGIPPFDFCKQNKNYMFYGNWKSRSLYMSNAYNRDSSLAITSVQAVQNDLVLGTTKYTGNAHHVYRITIDSGINQQTFTSGGEGSINNIVFDTSGYTGGAGITNIYTFSIIADATMLVPSATGAAVGDTITGSISGAIGTIVAFYSAGGSDSIGISMRTQEAFIDSDVVTLSTGGTFSGQDVRSFAWFQFTKNGITQNIDIGAGPQPSNVLIASFAPGTFPDGLQVNVGSIYGHAVGDTLQLTINTGSSGVDTFQYQIDGGAPVASHVPITGGAQSLGNGITVSFVSTTGHTIGDYWEITADPVISLAWDNFYYTLSTTNSASIRRPGEGYIYRLPSNFWTMDTQEENLYVNTQFGEWGVITTTLASDLLTETIDYEPLKQSGALKVIDPWLTGHLEDDLMFVTIDKSLMTLGRKQFLQEVQDGYLSDIVKLDFQACTFVGGGMKYIDKRFYIFSPEQGIAHCFDVAQKYWQAPKSFPEMGIPSLVGNQLIAHSNIRNQSFTMFTSTQGDNGMNYTVEMRTPATAYVKIVGRKRIPARWDTKWTSNTFIEGYITGNPQLIFTAYLGPNGINGAYPHPVVPIVSDPMGNAPLGEGSHGSHSFGSDEPNIFADGDYFNEIYKDYKPILSYYFIAFGITCSAKNHSYSILSLGANLAFALTGNNSLYNQTNDDDVDTL